MPYLDAKARSYADVYGPNDTGSLNYLITKLVLQFIDKVGPRYDTFNAAVGALECAKQEMYARMVRPYEDQKIKQNGDVYP